jgi:DNA-binding transcriptional LysR family regulator
MDLVATGPYITIFSESIQAVRATRSSIKMLPIDLPVSPWPLAIVTLRNRILNPVAERFIEHVRDYAASRSSPQTG